MKKYRLKAFSKINLSLRILKKLKNKYHKIQSFVTFGKPFDLISISLEFKEKKDKIIFFGKFKNSINTKSNTITKVLKILRKRGCLKNKVFKIYVEKNIPHGSGLGGGSADAAVLINFFNKKMNLNLKKTELFRLASKVGSDVPINLMQKNLFIDEKKNEIFKINKKYSFNILIVFPNLICSTKKIYQKNNVFSPATAISNKILNDKKKALHFLCNEHNDLQKTVVKIYPKIRKIINFIKIQNGCYFSRITGSGSACIGTFSTMKNASLAKKIIRNKFPKYWCTVSKTI